jgi:hypothetical protein
MAEPEQTRRAAAYIRKSTEEQGRGYSPDGQRQAVARYAGEHGMTLWPPRHQQGDQGPARADRRRGAVRPRAANAPPARTHPQTRQTVTQLPPARTRALPPLRRAHAKAPPAAGGTRPATTAPPAAPTTHATSRSSPPSTSSASSHASSPASPPTPRSASRSCTAYRPTRPRWTRPPSAATPWRSASAAHATSTSSATSPSRATSCAAKPSRKSCNASSRPPTPTSTAPRRSSATSSASGTQSPTPPSGASSSTASSTTYGRTTARSSPSKPRAAFAPYFKALEETRRKPPKDRRKRGVTKAGTTGVLPTFGTTSRFAREACRDQASRVPSGGGLCTYFPDYRRQLAVSYRRAAQASLNIPRFVAPLVASAVLCCVARRCASERARRARARSVPRLPTPGAQPNKRPTPQGLGGRRPRTMSWLSARSVGPSR